MRKRLLTRALRLWCCSSFNPNSVNASGTAWRRSRNALPINRYRIPPKELAETLPQQLLMLQVAAGALRDVEGETWDSHATGAFIGIELDMETNRFHFRWSLLERARHWAKSRHLSLSEDALNEWVESLREAAGPALSANRTMGALGGIVASRLAREFKIGGPCHTVSCEEASGLRALEAGMRALQQDELNLALVGAVDLAGDVRAALAMDARRPFSRRGDTRPFEIDSDGAIPGEGAAAVVLKRLDDALRDGDRVYAVLRGLGVSSGGGVDGSAASTEACETAIRRAHEEAGWDAASVEYLESHAGGYGPEDAAEAAAIARCFGGGGTRSLKLGSAKSQIGHAGAAASLASVVKASLALYHEILPPMPPRGEIREELQRLTREMRFLRSPQCWLRDRVAGPRRAGVTAIGVGGVCAHLALEALEGQDSERVQRERRQPLGSPSEALFAVHGEDIEELASALSRLVARATEYPSASITALAHAWHQDDPRPNGSRRLALLARDSNELAQLARTAAARLQGVGSGNNGHGENGGRRPDEERVFYSETPVGPAGVAFVYPGSGNHYLGMGRELGTLWPELFRRQDKENERLASQVVSESFWNGPSLAEINRDHHAMIFGQVAHGTVVTDLVEALRRAAAGGDRLQPRRIRGLVFHKGLDRARRNVSAHDRRRTFYPAACRAL